ncbi:MAG: succinate--CoA ligase subunit beta, partial [Deltaproteobacteria bacterium]|nr:succinate--CoA ligase subunit beta [Deltaproteobacteria bacterium]
MKLHEYEAKDIFGKSGIPIPNGQLVTVVDQATKVTQIISGPPWVVKAQVHTGGRG